MKSINQFSMKQEKLSAPESSKVMGGQQRVTVSETFVYKGNRYILETVDKKNSTSTRTKVEPVN